MSIFLHLLLGVSINIIQTFGWKTGWRSFCSVRTATESNSGPDAGNSGDSTLTEFFNYNINYCRNGGWTDSYC